MDMRSKLGLPEWAGFVRQRGLYDLKCKVEWKSTGYVQGMAG